MRLSPEYSTTELPQRPPASSTTTALATGEAEEGGSMRCPPAAQSPGAGQDSAVIVGASLYSAPHRPLVSPTRNPLADLACSVPPTSQVVVEAHDTWPMVLPLPVMSVPVPGSWMARFHWPAPSLTTKSWPGPVLG